MWQIASITSDARFLVLNYASRRRMDQLVKQSKLPVRVVDAKRAYVPLRPQKKPGTNTPPPKNHPDIEIDDPTGAGYLKLARTVLSLT